jgi:Protein of unknown function (DUF962)
MSLPFQYGDFGNQHTSLMQTCSWCIISPHVERTHLQSVDRAVREQPSASGEPDLPFPWYPSYRDFTRLVCRHHLPSPLVALRSGAFLGGWALQFVGHAFERKEPEFFHDWRFLLVGVRWWWTKMQGKA